MLKEGFPPDGKLVDPIGTNILPDEDKQKSPCLLVQTDSDYNYKRSPN